MYKFAFHNTVDKKLSNLDMKEHIFSQLGQNWVGEGKSE